VKLTNESPKGIRTNVLKSLSAISDERLDDCAKPHAWRKMLVSLCFFHSVVQERRKFGPIGWNIAYEFNESDLETSMVMVKNFLDDPSDRIPWDAITYMIGEINYGGRVTDDWDRRTLRSILSIFIRPEILDDTYRFSHSGLYYVPPDTTIDQYKTYVERLPHSDDPEIYGMHGNANIAFQKQESDLLI
jgi:dynein heavy chain